MLSTSTTAGQIDPLPPPLYPSLFLPFLLPAPPLTSHVQLECHGIIRRKRWRPFSQRIEGAANRRSVSDQPELINRPSITRWGGGIWDVTTRNPSFTIFSSVRTSLGVSVYTITCVHRLRKSRASSINSFALGPRIKRIIGCLFGFYI